MLVAWCETMVLLIMMSPHVMLMTAMMVIVDMTAVIVIMVTTVTMTMASPKLLKVFLKASP